MPRFAMNFGAIPKVPLAGDGRARCFSNPGGADMVQTEAPARNVKIIIGATREGTAAVKPAARP